jgi:serine/threonine-protein kinase
VIDFGDDGGLLYLVMDFVQGPTLKDHLLERGTLDAAEATRIAGGIASALHAAHSIGLVHRDLKPSNIILTPGAGPTRPVVIDFGLVKIFSEETHDEDVTASHMMVGTPAYMSPESVLGKPVDGRSDLYALGVLLFEMLTGRRPFHGDTQLEIATSRLHAPAPDLGDERPLALRRLVAELLEREPDDRTASADLLLRRLSSWPTRGYTPTTLLNADETIAPVRGPGARSEPAGSGPASATPDAPRSSARGPLSLYAFSLVFAVAVVASLAGGVFQPTDDTPHTQIETLDAPTIVVPTVLAAAAEPSESPRPTLVVNVPTDGAATEGSGEPTLTAADVSMPSAGADGTESTVHEPAETRNREPLGPRRSERSEPPRTGTLVVNASPYAAVFIDDILIDDETPADLTLPSGEYEVTTRYLDSELSERVRIRAGQTESITHRHD